MALPKENQMGMRVKAIVIALAVFAAASWAPSVIAQRGQGDGAQAQQGGQGAAPARGGGGGGQRGRGAAAAQPAGPVPRLANGKPDLSRSEEPRLNSSHSQI